MRDVLKNDYLQVEIDEHGAELSRIVDLATNEERLHDANPVFWNRHAPVLFPFVGACYDKTYRIDGQAYAMGQHGFARDMDFVPVATDEANTSVFVLKSTEETKAKYPYDFALEVKHTLVDRTVKVTWMVTNTSAASPMYFQIGAHPALSFPKAYSFAQVALDFHGEDVVSYFRIEDPGSGCVYENEPHTLATPGGKVTLTEDFFDQGVYILEKDTIQKVTMLVNDTPYVEMTCQGFPYFGVWSKPGANYVCLEPWYGRADAVGFDGDITEKAGEMKLLPGETFTASYEMRFL